MKDGKYQASEKPVLWAVTWPKLRTFVLVTGKTAREAYEDILIRKPPFAECEFLKAL